MLLGYRGIAIAANDSTAQHVRCVYWHSFGWGFWLFKKWMFRACGDNVKSAPFSSGLFISSAHRSTSTIVEVMGDNVHQNSCHFGWGVGEDDPVPRYFSHAERKQVHEKLVPKVHVVGARQTRPLRPFLGVSWYILALGFY